MSETERQAREERVREHYDAPPELFAHFLDTTLNYSTAFFAEPGMSLDAAQQAKLAAYADWLQAGPGKRLLDAGCGWGPLCLHLAGRGAIVTGLTLSPNQAAYANRRAAETGLADRVTVLCRPLLEHPLEDASLDGVSFIGSIIHMRERREVFARTAAALRPLGRLVVSETYFPDRGGDARGAGRTSRSSRYVLSDTFGFTHMTALSDELEAMEDAGFRTLRVEDSTDHYVRTLEAWLDRLRLARRDVDRLQPGAYHDLRLYLEVARTSLRRRTTLQYEIVAERSGA